MNPRTKDPIKELETALTELDERVDRLRGLYEQYFLGFEKSEPRVLRSDVDRRLAQLRKTPMKNTALRFRFNVVAQKFTTYSMYWARICRQIEDGTYKRHLNRAAKKFGTPTAPKAEEPSVEIRLDELEGQDMADLLAEANAAIDALSSGPTMPRAPSPATSFPSTSASSPSRSRHPLADVPTEVSPLRPMRQASLPPGSRPPALARRRSDEPPMSGSMLPAPPPPPLELLPEPPPPSLRAPESTPRGYRPAAQGPVSVRSPVSVRAPVSVRGPVSVRAPVSVRVPEAPPSAPAAPESRRIVRPKTNAQGNESASTSEDAPKGPETKRS